MRFPPDPILGPLVSVWQRTQPDYFCLCSAKGPEGLRAEDRSPAHKLGQKPGFRFHSPQLSRLEASSSPLGSHTLLPGPGLSLQTHYSYRHQYLMGICKPVSRVRATRPALGLKDQLSASNQPDSSISRLLPPASQASLKHLVSRPTENASFQIQLLNLRYRVLLSGNTWLLIY